MPGGNRLKLRDYMKLKGKSKRKKNSAWGKFDIGPTERQTRYDTEITERRPNG